MKVKICGIRDYETARVALDCGAWALGFVFHPPSPRFVEPDRVAEIIRRVPAGVLTVGVFVDWPLDSLNEAVRTAGLGAAQLHGSEDLAYARGVRAGMVIKALRAEPGFDPRRVLDFPGCSILLDAYHPTLAGGTGIRVDWSLARRAAEHAPIILAGGLDPESVKEAILAVRPAAIDVSSGVESAPGAKDRQKIRRLFAEVEGAER